MPFESAPATILSYTQPVTQRSALRLWSRGGRDKVLVPCSSGYDVPLSTGRPEFNSRWNRQILLPPEGNMESYQQRVIDERDALQKKRIDLGNFLRSENFETVVASRREKVLLQEQFRVMIAYEGILDERISFYPVQPVPAVEKKSEL